MDKLQDIFNKYLQIECEPRHLSDCKRIQSVLQVRGVFISLNDTEKIWEELSDSSCASWLFLDESDDELYERIVGFVSNRAGE